MKSLSFSPTNKVFLCSVGLDKNCAFYETSNQSSVMKITTPAPLSSVTFSPDGQSVAVGGNGGTLLIYDLRNNSKPVLSLEGHKFTVNCIQYKFKESLFAKSKSSEYSMASVTSD